MKYVESFGFCFYFTWNVWFSKWKIPKWMRQKPNDERNMKRRLTRDVVVIVNIDNHRAKQAYFFLQLFLLLFCWLWTQIELNLLLLPASWSVIRDYFYHTEMKWMKSCFENRQISGDDIHNKRSHSTFRSWWDGKIRLQNNEQPEKTSITVS